ncbi:MAG: Rrf2 family transcriptional regulator [Nitrosomonadaceae bacterium]|jgi:Rrf2 family iron-sulfur cluster assembly transcriptional regulator|nr:Rrf2 family transcriptional regulator [Nitrosomonadaceae bacterium]MDC0576311.1 Rrf2 family transcriptional regulator [Nitrosomonadaceae bacterium]
MRLTTRGRFAVTALLDLAMQRSKGPVKLAEISKRQQISLSYLEQLFTKLRQRELVDSVRGPGGGYCLAKEMEHVSVADIILAVDEPIDSTQCGGKENCHNDNKCITHDLWKNLNALIFNHLGSINLKQLVDEQKLNKENIIKIVDIHKLTSNQEYTSS